MEHEEIQALLSDYHEDVLPPETRRIVAHHLSSCRICQNDLTTIRGALELAKRIPPVTAPPDFVGRVRQRAHKLGYLKGRRHARQNRFFVMWEATLAVLLATVGALIVLMLFWQQLPLKPQPIEHPRHMLVITNAPDVQTVFATTWTVGGTVSIKGKIVPPGSTISIETEADLFVPHARWKEYREILVRKGLGSSLSLDPRVRGDEMVHIVASEMPDN